MRVTKNVAAYIEKEVTKRLHEGKYAAQLADAKAADTLHEDVLNVLKETLNTKVKEEARKWADQYDFFEISEKPEDIIGDYTLSRLIQLTEPCITRNLERKITAKAKEITEGIIVELELGATKEWLTQKLAEI